MHNSTNLVPATRNTKRDSTPNFLDYCSKKGGQWSRTTRLFTFSPIFAQFRRYRSNYRWEWYGFHRQIIWWHRIMKFSCNSSRSQPLANAWHFQRQMDNTCWRGRAGRCLKIFLWILLLAKFKGENSKHKFQREFHFSRKRAFDSWNWKSIKTHSFCTFFCQFGRDRNVQRFKKKNMVPCVKRFIGLSIEMTTMNLWFEEQTENLLLFRLC